MHCLLKCKLESITGFDFIAHGLEEERLHRSIHGSGDCRTEHFQTALGIYWLGVTPYTLILSRYEKKLFSWSGLIHNTSTPKYLHTEYNYDTQIKGNQLTLSRKLYNNYDQI